MSIVLQLPVPLGAVVTQTYAEHVARNLPRYNGGIDYGVQHGTPIRCAAAGKVSRLGNDPQGYGIYVMVGHADNYTTLYGHLSAVAVQIGQALEAGALVGTSGSTGNSTGPHLHFELRHMNKPIDPEPYYAAAPVEPDTGAVEAERINGTAEIICFQLLIRRGPGTNYEIAGALPEGVRVVCCGRMGDWLKIAPDAWIVQRWQGQELVKLL